MASNISPHQRTRLKPMTVAEVKAVQAAEMLEPEEMPEIMETATTATATRIPSLPPPSRIATVVTIVMTAEATDPRNRMLEAMPIPTASNRQNLTAKTQNLARRILQSKILGAQL